MAATWGRAEIQVDVDGTALPRQVRALAEKAGAVGGASMGDAFNKSFGQRLREGMRTTFDRVGGWFKGIWGRLFRRGGKNVGDGFTDGFKDSMKSFRLEFDKISTDVVRQSQEMARAARDVDFGRWAEDMGRFRRVFPELESGMKAITSGGKDMERVFGDLDFPFHGMTEDIGELFQVFEKGADGARELSSGMDDADKSGRKFGRTSSWLNRVWTKLGLAVSSFDGGGIGNFFKSLSGDADDAGKSLGKHQGLWSRLSHNTRQWTLIIGSVLAGMEGIAVLGSAAGAGILALGSALVSAGIGVGVLVTVFGNLGGELENLPAAVRPAARAFQGLGKVFDTLRDTLQVDALADTTEAWESLGKTIEALTPAFKPLTRVINGLVKDMATNLQPGTRAFDALFKLIESAAPVFDRLARVAGDLGIYLMEAFVGVTPLVEDLLGWIEDLVGAFGDFTGDAERMSTWVSQAQQVFGALGGVLDSLGTMFSGLVDQAAVDRLVAFADNVSRFVDGGLTDLLNILGELDVFGVIADALATLGDALHPLAGPMEDLAAAFNDVLESGIDQLGPIFEDIADALAPFVQGLADFMDENPDAIATGLLAIAGAAVVLKGSAGLAGLSAKIGGVSGALNKFTTGKGWKTLVGGVGLGALIGGAIATSDEGGDIEAGFSSVLDGALMGAVVGMAFGPIGAVLGALLGAAMTANTSQAIQDFEDSVNTGLEDFFTGLNETVNGWFMDIFAEVGNFFVTLGTNFQTGMAAIGEGLGTIWGGVAAAFEGGWNQIVDFFTVSVPQFFADVGQWFADGWTLVTLTFDAYIGQPIQTAWEGLVNFFTVEVPRFFANVVTGFQTGWTTLTRVFTTFGGIISGIWNTIWLNLIGIVTTIWSGIVNTVRGWWLTLVGIFTSMGATISGIWTGIWSGLTGIVSSIWNGIVSTIRGAVNTITGIINGLTAKVNGAIGLLSTLSAGIINLPKIPSIPKLASGGVLMGPRRILAGEAGPEAVVPLNRPLSMVNPSVRGLAAFAQGKSDFSGEGGTGRQRIVNIAPGAIVVSGVLNPTAAAHTVVNRIAERVAS